MSSYLRRNWKFVLISLFLPLAISLPFLPFTHGAGRWIFIGAAGISGPWLAVTTTLLLSGAATPLMGLDGEISTADVLPKLRRGGWMLVNGIKIQRNADIDHVVIGPAGILVVESKWSHYRWPTTDQNQTFMSRQLKSSVTQALKNRNDVATKFAEVLEGVSIRAVCVLWSSEDSSDDPGWFECSDVLVVRGPAFGSWLNTQTEVLIEQPKIEGIWEEIEHFALECDEYDLSQSGPPRPTISGFMLHSVLAGLMSALYGLLVLVHARLSWLVGGILIFIALGFMASKRQFLRRAAQGWTVASVSVGLLLLGFVIRTHMR